MIETGMECFEILKGKIRDIHRISAGFITISCIREKRMHDITLKH